MKKIALIVLALTLIPLTVLANTVPSFTITHNVDGNIVTAAVDISNNPGIVHFDIKLFFDNTEVAPIAITKSSLMEDRDIISNLDEVGRIEPFTDVTAFWIYGDELTENGELFTVTFDLIGTLSDTPFTVQCRSYMTNEEATEIEEEIIKNYEDWSDNSFIISDRNEKEENSSDSLENSNNPIFDDITDYSWAETAINNLADRKIISGAGNGKFEPERNINRQEFAKIIIGVCGISPINGNTGFVDVNPGEWYNEWVFTALQNGLIQGYSDEIFGIDDPITREQAATIIYRALVKRNYTLESGIISYTDANMTSDYAVDAIMALSASNIITGYPDGSFRPGGSLTRAEAAVLLHRVLTNFFEE